ncbi:uncharacterized protein LOC128496919 isoform X2 [Spea bombifrons]|uniref:uncharacterized protein LOC128496919 isoform X2 n=1 Tax=Spea bombifrons TaxID=233779 RepID=UPI0023498D3D|nr:uncharacterized protein LOC128496919 isoform X2 [Spea bombifrons]
MDRKSNSNAPSTSTAGSIISFKFNKTPSNTEQKQKIVDSQHRQQSGISEYKVTKEGFPCFTCRTWFLTTFNRDSHCTLLTHKLKDLKLQAELEQVIENLSRADFSQSDKREEISSLYTEVPCVKDKDNEVPDKDDGFSIRNNKDLKDFLENFEITKSSDVSFVLHVISRITAALTEYEENRLSSKEDSSQPLCHAFAPFPTTQLLGL